jgi:hypothetical protein
VARLSLRDRFFTPPVARAITSPGGILLAGAGASVGIVAGLPLAAAAAIAAALWAGRVAVAVPRNPSPERIDPFAVKEPWRRFVSDALKSQRRFEEAVRATRKGPLRDRMGEIATRIDTGVREGWRIARAGQALAEARSAIDVTVVMGKIRAVTPPGADPPAPESAGARTIEALNAQLQTARRLDDLVTDTQARLRLLDARLAEATAQAIELSVRAQGADELGALSQDVDDVATEMQALRLALVETDTSPAAPVGELPGEPAHRPPPPEPQTGTG